MQIYFCTGVKKRKACGFVGTAQGLLTRLGSAFLSFADLLAWQELHNGCKFSESQNSPPNRTGLM